MKIPTLIFLGKTLDYLVTRVGMRNGFQEANQLTATLVEKTYLVFLLNFIIAIIFYLVYENLKENKIIKDMVHFIIATNFIVAGYNFVLMIQ